MILIEGEGWECMKPRKSMKKKKKKVTSGSWEEEDDWQHIHPRSSKRFDDVMLRMLHDSCLKKTQPLNANPSPSALLMAEERKTHQIHAFRSVLNKYSCKSGFIIQSILLIMSLQLGFFHSKSRPSLVVFSERGGRPSGGRPYDGEHSRSHSDYSQKKNRRRGR